MSDVKLANIPSMSVGKLIEKLGTAYGTVIAGGLPVKTMPSVMLWGPPGIGKSQAVRQIASDLRERTGKEVRVTDVRLLLFNPIDLRGIPTANADKTLAVWLRPQIFQMDSSEDIVNILFLDEPVAGLDPKVTQDMYEMIKTLNEIGITIVMISHDIEAALEYSNHILHLNKDVDFFGTTEEYKKTELCEHYLCHIPGHLHHDDDCEICKERSHV